MLTIRLTRKGKKNQPFFRVVLVDKRKSSKSGRALEDLGYKNPLTKKISLKKDRILYWISKGAEPSPSVHNLLVTEKIIDAKKINVSKKLKKVAEVAATPSIPAATSAPAPAPEAKSEEPKAEPTSAPEGSGEAKEEKPVELEKPAA